MKRILTILTYLARCWYSCLTKAHKHADGLTKKQTKNSPEMWDLQWFVQDISRVELSLQKTEHDLWMCVSVMPCQTAAGGSMPYVSTCAPGRQWVDAARWRQLPPHTPRMFFSVSPKILTLFIFLYRVQWYCWSSWWWRRRRLHLIIFRGDEAVWANCSVWL